MRRNQTKDPITQYFLKIVTESLKEFKTPINQPRSQAFRIALWNQMFPDTKMHPSTKIRELILTVLRRYIVMQTDTVRFCFELATTFLGLPKAFYEFINPMPYPINVALKLSMKIIIDSIPKPNEANQNLFLSDIQTLPEQEYHKLILSIQDLNSDRIDISIANIYQILNKTQFDLFLSILPPKLHLHYSLSYGRPPPKITIDFENIILPFEFIQAISDIDGVEEGHRLLGLSKNV